MKKCIYCKQNKKEDQFPKRKNHNKSGVQYVHSACYLCQTKRTKEWIKNNQEKYKEYQRAYQRKYKQT